jgi:hypothetical protein
MTHAGIFFEFMNKSELTPFQNAQIEAADMEEYIGKPVDFIIHPDGTSFIPANYRYILEDVGSPLTDVPLAEPIDSYYTIEGLGSFPKEQPQITETPNTPKDRARVVRKFISQNSTRMLSPVTQTKLYLYKQGRTPREIYERVVVPKRTVEGEAKTMRLLEHQLGIPLKAGEPSYVSQPTDSNRL